MLGPLFFELAYCVMQDHSAVAEAGHSVACQAPQLLEESCPHSQEGRYRSACNHQATQAKMYSLGLPELHIVEERFVSRPFVPCATLISKVDLYLLAYKDINRVGDLVY